MAEIINSYDNGSEIKVVYSYTQNQASNTSTLTMTLYVHRDGYGPSWDQECEAYIKLDGTKVMTYGGAFEIGSSWVKIGSTVSKTVTHNSDGEKTVTIEGFFDGYNVSSKVQDLKCSGSVKLTTIPRGSSISSITGSTIGEPVTVKISREVSSFTHKVYYTLGNVKNRLLGSDVGTSLTFTPPMSDCEQITGSAKGTATIRVDTYNGSTKIGSSSKNFTLNVPSSVVPSFTGISFTRIDGDVPASWGVYVQGKSKVTAAITGAAGAYGSTIKSYSISGGGYSGTGSSLTTGTLKEAGAITFTAKITDSRGRTATKTARITVEVYAPPVLSSVETYRCDASGTLNDLGAYLALTAEFSCSPVQGHNTITGRYRIRPEGGEWSSYSTVYSGVRKIFPASPDSTFAVQVEVSDAFATVTNDGTANSTEFIMDFKAGGNGIAFGKAAEYDDTLDCAWGSHFRSDMQVDGEARFLGEFVPPWAGGTAYLNTNMGTVSTNAQVPLNKLAASYGGVALSGNGLKIPSTGYYVVDGQLMINDGAAGLYLGLLIDSVNLGTLADSYIGFSKGYGVINCNNTIVKLNAGDVVRLYARCSGAASGVTINSNTRTKLSVFRIF